MAACTSDDLLGVHGMVWYGNYRIHTGGVPTWELIQMLSSMSCIVRLSMDVE